jgi:hypothetical protein
MGQSTCAAYGEEKMQAWYDTQRVVGLVHVEFS